MVSLVPDDDARSYLEVGGHALHYEWLGKESNLAPLIFLHEGLGSVELWRSFPQAVVEASGRSALVYSRYGNGWSEPPGEERREVRYMHDEALVLAEIVDDLVGRAPILVGHSDGASIAIIYASAGQPVPGLVLLAPHIFVERETTATIDALRLSYPGSEMAEKMGKYHREPETTFWNWNDIWLDEKFQQWNLEELLGKIDCPVQLIQGEADEYGTIKQLEAIEAGLAGPVERLVVSGAGHAPHLAEPDLVVAAVVRFLGDLR